MYCIKCGKKLDDDSVFCSACGTKIEYVKPAYTDDQLIDWMLSQCRKD